MLCCTGVGLEAAKYSYAVAKSIVTDLQRTFSEAP